jgi:cysteinyl-tRNA synthetase/glutamyl-tRNA synthetase
MPESLNFIKIGEPALHAETKAELPTQAVCVENNADIFLNGPKKNSRKRPCAKQSGRKKEAELDKKMSRRTRPTKLNQWYLDEITGQAVSMKPGVKIPRGAIVVEQRRGHPAPNILQFHDIKLLPEGSCIIGEFGARASELDKQMIARFCRIAKLANIGVLARRTMLDQISRSTDPALALTIAIKHLGGKHILDVQANLINSPAHPEYKIDLTKLSRELVREAVKVGINAGNEKNIKFTAPLPDTLKLQDRLARNLSKLPGIITDLSSLSTGSKLKVSCKSHTNILYAKKLLIAAGGQQVHIKIQKQGTLPNGKINNLFTVTATFSDMPIDIAAGCVGEKPKLMYSIQNGSIAAHYEVQLYGNTISTTPIFCGPSNVVVETLIIELAKTDLHISMLLAALTADPIESCRALATLVGPVTTLEAVRTACGKLTSENILGQVGANTDTTKLMPVLSLYDTATQEIRELGCREPGKLGMYLCGPTVYGPPHIGHGRATIVYDILRRYMEWCGVEVRLVSNITDIDDKIIDRAQLEGRLWSEIASECEDVWFETMGKLGVKKPTDIDTPHATEYVEQMVEMIEKLVEGKFAYLTCDGVYMDITTVSDYGLLALQSLDDMLSNGEREVLGVAAKRNTADFALWKFSKPGEPAWTSPWGDGRPGWHSECVVMSLELLGENFDLHCGGEDLRFPHHENERAQAVALNKVFAQHWMHHAFVVDTTGVKMSKSLGNVTNLVDLIEHYDPRAFRIILLQSHYRSPVKIGQDTIDAACRSLANLDAFVSRMVNLDKIAPDQSVLTKFRELMNNDLDTPGAVAHIFEAISQANTALDRGNKVQAASLAAAVIELFGAVGLVLGQTDEIDEVVKQRAADLDAARSAKDFASADAIRMELQEAGFIVETTKEGTHVSAQSHYKSPVKVRQDAIDAVTESHANLDTFAVQMAKLNKIAPSQSDAHRYRFAPSPTGFFHVGGGRTALYNWILALQNDGVFVLRIEDTDESRNHPQWTQGILDALAWLGIDSSDPHFEGPYFQSSFAAAHVEAAEALFASGHAYYYDLTSIQVQERAKASGLNGYDDYSRDLGLGPGPGRVLRFRVPVGLTVIRDIVRGDVTFANDTIEDFVLLRSNGTPVFLLANVVDDIAMNITDVVRAEEHLSNTPKQQMLWNALGAPLPTWAHVPVLVNKEHKKLSKRRDKVAVKQYRSEGVLPQAMISYLMTLGWAPSGDSEIVPWSSIVDEFRLEDVNHSPAFFDVKKMNAFNGEYIRALSLEDFIEACQSVLGSENVPWPAHRFDAAVFRAMAPLVQTRVAVLAEVPALVDFLFMAEPIIDGDAFTKAFNTKWARPTLIEIAARFEKCEWTADALKTEVEAVGMQHDVKLGKLQAPLRVAITGRSIGAPLFEPIELLGRDESLRRVNSAVQRAAR